MDSNEILEMINEDLKKYLNTRSSKKMNKCAMCGSLQSDKAIIVEHKTTLAKQKLCNLCENCYVKVLDFMGVTDLK